MTASVEEILASQQSVIVATVLAAEGDPDLVGSKLYLTPEVMAGDLSCHPLTPQIQEKSLLALQQESVMLVELPQQEGAVQLLLEPLHPAAELLVLGAGHIAQPLVQLAATLQYNITVVDDRPSFANHSRFPGARKILCEDFNSVFGQLTIGPYTSVVLVTRGHRYDLTCLEQVLNYQCGYIGMIGSRRRIKLIRQQLLDSGVPMDILNRLHMPIGLDIGAQTPEEIAVSIAAELIAVRRRGKARSLSDGLVSEKGLFNMPPTSTGKERQILQRALELRDGGTPVVMATIIQTKGSTPRKAGAKMLILQDGRTYGTIGGGCGEAEVRREALMLFDQGGCRRHLVMMDADTAAEEGMVCGGSMEVFLERLD